MKYMYEIFILDILCDPEIYKLLLFSQPFKFH